ncbi:MAG: thermopsin family protease [Thermoplasmata archaeon]|nr:thermopsin family protease [Thermoplasmata archaeon]
MPIPPSHAAPAVILTLLVAFSSLGLTGSLHGVLASNLPTPTGGHTGLPNDPKPSSSAPPLASDSVTPPLGPPRSFTTSRLGSDALAASRAIGFPSRFVFVPRPAADPLEVRSANAAGHITPLYQASPAPMGIGEFGLRAATNGSILPYLLNTTSLEGTFAPNSTGIQPRYVLDSSPDAYSVQLNAVLTNVTLFGNASYHFWTQNVVIYYAQSHVLYLVSNVWNFSGPLFSANALSSHGPNGTLIGTSLYASETKLTGITYPFDMALFLNSTVVTGRDAINFTVDLNAGAGPTRYTYDYVVFNSTVLGGPSVTGPAGYSANGFRYNPLGLTDDFEFILGGPGGGSQVNLFAAQATMALRFWNGSVAGYQSVPSALSYGGDSGETSSGANVEWEPSTGGPYAQISTGPSVLSGLWNASGPSGVATVTTAVQPSNAFIFVQPAAGPFTISEPEWAPTIMDASLAVAPGSYTITALMSYYDPTSAAFPGLVSGGLSAFNPALTPDPLTGVTTPIWVWSNSQFPAISSSGSGTPADPYLIDDQQNSPMPSIFGVMNAYTFPVFSGVQFMGTTSSVELLKPGPFQVQVPYTPGTFPATNELPYIFYGVSNVSVLDAPSISGWYSLDLYAGYPAYAAYNMVFWNSSHNLVAGNAFDTESQGIFLYGGTANTIWNNTIQWVPAPGNASFPLWPSALSVGVQDAESGDLLYNNAIYNTNSASAPRIDPYTGSPSAYLDRWNITMMLPSVVNFAPGFPNIPLTGSIVGGTYQGGNFWWDYGLPDNPFNLLPYNANGSIALGGDFVPLVALFSVTFQAPGCSGSSSWSVTLNGVPESSVSPTIVFSGLSDGTYSYVVAPPAHFVVVPPSGSFDLFRSITIQLRCSYTWGFAAGTVVPATASVFVNGTQVPVTPLGKFNATDPPGRTMVEAMSPAYYPYFVNVSIAPNATTLLSITLEPLNGTLRLTVVEKAANVTINGTSVPLSNGSLVESLLPGNYSIVTSFPLYDTNRTTVSISSNATTWVNISLIPAPNGTLDGTVTPASAAVAVGGVIVSVSTQGAFTRSLRPGPYVVEASASGYISSTVQVNVSSGRTTFANLTLLPLTTRPGGLSPLDWELIGIGVAITILLLVVTLIVLRRGRTPPPIAPRAPSSAPSPAPAGPVRPGTR